MNAWSPAALGAALLLAGCAVGPRYRPPPLPAGAGAPLLTPADRQESAAPVPDTWWQLYSDPVLSALITEALTANQDLAAASANLAGSRALLERARAARLPQTDLNLGGVYGRDPTTDLIQELNGRQPFTYWIWDELLDVSYEVDLFGRVRRGVEAARAGAGAAAAARDALKVTVAAETARTYLTVCTTGEQIDVELHNLEVVTRVEQITAARLEAGAGTQLDLARTQALEAQVRALLPVLTGQRRVALLSLTQVLGRVPAAAPEDVLSCRRAPALSAPLPAGDARALLERRPDVREAERQLAAATAQIGVATADLFPRVRIGGFYGGVAPEVGDLGTNAGLAWGAGPSITWAFPNMAGPLAEVAHAKAGAAAALARFNSVVLTALKETGEALATYGAETGHHEALLQLVERSQRAFDLSRAQYVAGAASSLDLLTAETTLIAAEGELARSDAALTDGQVRLFKALGGGWKVHIDP
jgi:NodT family efflux transporter outer membrane factor (OMF) lipoprotein